MRQIVLDTETTGLEPSAGHRIIEIGCIEIVDRRITSKRYHQYINPERDIDPGAVEVHGLTTEFLASKPCFHEIVGEFIAFVKDAELIIHNAPFDVGFIDAELAALGEPWESTERYCRVFDTLRLARDLHPGQRNSLDALCRRYEVDNAHRELHGALLDAELLADVYLLMTGGQADLSLQSARDATESTNTNFDGNDLLPIDGLRVLPPTDAEQQAHLEMLEFIDKESADGCHWPLHESGH
ncbi:MAG: DNA polymerase III subunit epsilon [Pseudomonadota bacterium]